MKQQRVRTKPDKYAFNSLVIGGWLCGKRSYLWFGSDHNHCLGTLSDQKLYRLAKAIVRQFEGGK